MADDDGEPLAGSGAGASFSGRFTELAAGGAAAAGTATRFTGAGEAAARGAGDAVAGARDVPREGVGALVDSTTALVAAGGEPELCATRTDSSGDGPRSAAAEGRRTKAMTPKPVANSRTAAATESHACRGPGERMACIATSAASGVDVLGADEVSAS